RKIKRRNIECPPVLKKEARYQLGRSFEKVNKYSLAIREYNKILCLNYDYKDIKKRISEIEGGIVS
ncbi:MAG: hypothetical protein ACOCRX_12470, partial [Candidatus Woesearchaeota archaeon]